jgi:hypothetical protein
MYRKLSVGLNVVYAKDIWNAKLPLKIRIFSWLLVLHRLPTSKLIADRHDPASGFCVVCGVAEDTTYIFFSCSLARLAWSVFRRLLGCDWSPTNFAQLFTLFSTFAGRPQRTVWALFLAQSWALWTIRNKLVIERKVINHPADIVFKSSIFLQLWWPSAKGKDQGALR